jgi:coenzyme F420-dependent glucose-6-phosphate dehydrogenase
MTRYFFGASHEEYPPEALLRHAVAAERAGFDGISASDHLQPWWEPGESGHTWVWLGAAGQATERIPLGTGVTATGARYHPAMIAQAWMTLERMFPGRPFLGIGSGEALNEVPVGDDWPSTEDQIARLDEALGFIRRLWDGETITEDGRFYRLKDCKVHSLADRRPPIWVSAFGPQAAEVAGRHGDGLWTLPDPESTPEVIDAYREARRKAGHEGDGEIVSSRWCRGRRATTRRSSRRASGRARSRRTTSPTTGTGRRRCTSTASRRSTTSSSPSRSSPSPTRPRSRSACASSSSSAAR